jgi:hypothetical protein
MGSNDGAETCQLVGTYILNEIATIIPKSDVGLYRDDGLAVVQKPPSETERIKKKLCGKFRELGLKITVTANVTNTDFLDVTFDLVTKQYRPYTKPGNKLQYVHTDSNHPPSVTRQIPKSIAARLSNISSNESIFKESIPEYQSALEKAGHKEELSYKATATNVRSNRSTENKKRKRLVTWFNPPFSRHVKTKVGKSFLELVEKHFPKAHVLHKIINKNTVKISYSCMSNMKNIIAAHNSAISNKQNTEVPRCNCRKKDDCPLPGKCTSDNIIYEATITTPHETKNYIGLASTSFKARYANHKASFTDSRKRNSTEISKYVWAQKDNSIPYKITWKILKNAKPYSPRTSRCNLCLWEKFYIISADKSKLLNSRSELISTCRHKRKYLLAEYG